MARQLSQDKLDRKVKRSRVDRFGYVFVLILFTLVANAFLSQERIGLLVLLVLQAAVLILALRASRASFRTLVIYGIAIAISFTIVVFTAVVTSDHNLRIVSSAINLVLIGAVPVVIGKRLATHPKITMQTVFGALSIYLLIGMFYAVLYSMSSLIMGAPFFVEAPPYPSTIYLYYSYVTLATVGYGDYTAASSVGQMLSVTEALIGQIYLVTVVAVLVANIGRQKAEPLAAEEPPDADETGPSETLGQIAESDSGR